MAAKEVKFSVDARLKEMLSICEMARRAGHPRMGRDPKAYGWRVRTKSYAPRGVSLAARGMPDTFEKPCLKGRSRPSLARLLTHGLDVESNSVAAPDVCVLPLP
jgi:hypothetical protein